jgi:cytosine/adenosine deaminase-related metal-dependent hydrolase
MPRTLIRGRFVIGFDGDDHVIVRDGSVVYEGDRIVHVGHGYAAPVDETIDVGDGIVAPGFIDLDALADIDHAIIDTWQPRSLALGLQWSEEYARDRRRDVFSREDEAFQRQYALVQLLLNGITTAMPIAAETHKGWAETLEQVADMAQAAGELGIRMYMGPSYRSGVNVVRADGTRDVHWDEPLGERGLAEAVEFVRRFDGAFSGRIRGSLLPCRIETVTPALLRETRRWSDELGCLVRIHAAQGADERRFIRRWHDRAPIEFLDDLGFLGPRVSIPHAIFIRGSSLLPDDGPDELAILARTATTVIHCPLTSIRHGRILESFDRYRAAGVNVALGTDTFPPDMIRVMDYGSNMAKLAARDESAGQAADLFRAATLGGARALQRDDLGRLAVGAKADIVVVDASPLRTGPLDDPIRSMLLNMNGSHVRHVIVDGRVVVRDGAIPGLDVAAMRARAQAYFETMKAAYSERDFQRRSADTLFPPSFRVVEPPR